MVYTKKKLSKKKNNSTRIIKEGSFIRETTRPISTISPSQQVGGGSDVPGAVLPATSFLTEKFSADTMTDLGPSGIGTGAATLTEPIAAAVGAELFVSFNTYSVIGKKRIKKRIKHFIKKQMLNILDDINNKSKQGNLADTKYPPLKHYDSFKSNVKQFFIDYKIFDKLAEIFISMQSSMFHFYSPEKLMLPIYFQQKKEDEPDNGINLDLNDQIFKKFTVGSNFYCFYDYLSTYDYLYFYCDQLNDGITRQFVRVKLSSKFMTSKTPEEICRYFTKRLKYVSNATDITPIHTKEVLLQNGGAFGLTKKYTFDVPDIPKVDTDGLMGLTVDETDRKGTLGVAFAPFVINYVGLTKLFRSKIVDVVTINNNDVKNSSRAISKADSITTQFAINVISLMQFPPFVKVIQKQIIDFRTSYLKDFQAEADNEDDKIDLTPTQTEEEAKLEAELEAHLAKIAEMQEDLEKTKTERDTVKSEADALKEKYKEDEDREKLEKEKDEQLIFDLGILNKERARTLRENDSIQRQKARQAAIDTNAEQLMEIQSDQKYTGPPLPEKKPTQVKHEKGKGQAGQAGQADQADQSGGALFGPSMRARGNVIKSSKSKMFQGLRTRKFTEDEKHLFVEFVYYSTYAFYHVFSKTLKVRESEMKKFFGDYIDDVMEMFKKNFSTVINSLSIYIAIARSLAITFEKKLGAAFNVKSETERLMAGEQSIKNITATDQNRGSTLNQAGQIENQLNQEKIFSSDSFFNLKNKKIRDFILKTYRNIRDLEDAMDDSNLSNRQFKVASRLDYRFTVEILGKEPMKQGLIENAQVRQVLANVFAGNFGMFRNVLEGIDKAIDEFDGISTDKLLGKLQLTLPKLTSLGPEGIVFQFDERLLKMGTGQGDLLSQQIEQKRKELRELERKQSKVASLIGR